MKIKVPPTSNKIFVSPTNPKIHETKTCAAGFWRAEKLNSRLESTKPGN